MKFFQPPREVLRSLSQASSKKKKPKNQSLLFVSLSKTKNQAKMEGVFPDALTPLVEADPEVFGILEDEKKRQW